MDDDVTRFTAIKGIGKRTDARLHEAGVDTWHSLAEVLMALSTIREASSERLGDMGRQAAKRASRTRDGATTEARDVERPHGFVVEITFDPSGGALRSSVTDVRAGRGQQWAGWEPASLISFIEQRTGLDGSPATAPARPARAVRSRRPAAQRPRPAAKRTPNEPNGRDRLNGLDEPNEPSGLHGRSSHRPRRPSASAGRSAVDRGRSRSWSSWALRVRRHRRALARRSPSSTPRSVSVRWGRPPCTTWRGRPRPRRSRSSPSSSPAWTSLLASTTSWSSSWSGDGPGAPPRPSATSGWREWRDPTRGAGWHARTATSKRRS